MTCSLKEVSSWPLYAAYVGIKLNALDTSASIARMFRKYRVGWLIFLSSFWVLSVSAPLLKYAELETTPYLMISFSLGRSALCLFFRRSLCLTGYSSTELSLICRIFSFLKPSKSISSLLLQKRVIKVLWTPHLANWIKVNTDGASTGVPNKAACGGMTLLIMWEAFPVFWTLVIISLQSLWVSFLLWACFFDEFVAFVVRNRLQVGGWCHFQFISSSMDN